MFLRIWRKGKTCTLLVGMQIGAATMENSVEVPQKTKDRVTIWSSNYTAGYTFKGNKNINSEIYMHHSFHRSLFTIANIRKQTKWPATDEWRMYGVYIYTMKYYSAKKERNFDICNNMDGLECIMLSEISQTEGNKYSLMSLICGIWKNETNMNIREKKMDSQI